MRRPFNERTSYFPFNFNPVVQLCVLWFFMNPISMIKENHPDVDVHAKTFSPMNFRMMKFSRSPISAWCSSRYREREMRTKSVSRAVKMLRKIESDNWEITISYSIIINAPELRLLFSHNGWVNSWHCDREHVGGIKCTAERGKSLWPPSESLGMRVDVNYAAFDWSQNGIHVKFESNLMKAE